MTIDWLDDKFEPLYAQRSQSGLVWLACAVGDAADDGHTSFVASTDTIDRMGDIIEQSTWNTRRFKQNPVILSDHSGRDVVGRAVKVGRTKNEAGKTELRVEVEWDDDERNPRGVLIAHQHRSGFRKAVSVGFIPGQSINRTELDPTDERWVNPKDVPSWRAGYVYRHPELLEISSVGVPANPDALEVPRGADDQIRKAVREVFASLISPTHRRREATNPNPANGLGHLFPKAV